VAATPEAKVKAKIKKTLKDNNVYFAMPIGTGYGSSGVPDFLCCVNGNFLAIEAKAGKGTTTALQDKNIREIKESGGMAVVIAEEQLELGYLEQLIQLMRS
jgi:pantoate kinase